jgi:hypothetical protein
LPEPPARFPDRPEIIERAVIRIRSARTWPEKVVLNTSQPTIPTPSIEVVPTEQLVAPLPDEMTDQTRVDSPAKPNPDARPIDADRRPARAKRKPAADARTVRGNDHLAFFVARLIQLKAEPLKAPDKSVPNAQGVFANACDHRIISPLGSS